MNTQTLVENPGMSGDRSVPAGTRRDPDVPGCGRSAEAAEVVAIAQRRKFTAAYKHSILSEIENNPSKTGVILRREGLYSSTLTKWRRKKDDMNKPISTNKQMHNELARLQRENERLKMKLQKAEGLIDLQKKTSELLAMMYQSRNDEK
jgi:hypothetical protein